MINDPPAHPPEPQPRRHAHVKWWAAIDWIGSQRPIDIVPMMVTLAALVRS